MPIPLDPRITALQEQLRREQERTTLLTKRAELLEEQLRHSYQFSVSPRRDRKERNPCGDLR